jgi:lipopolysaccharide biosynthesis protein
MLQNLRDRYHDYLLNQSIIWEKAGNASLYLQRLLFFAHYDQNAKIQPYVVYYLQQLALEGFSIIFITTSEKMPQSELASVTNYCAHFICKKNTGFDFGSWKIGLSKFDSVLDNYEAIILANDSCYAPAFDWTPMLGMFQQQKLDICGVTFNIESREKQHLQRYFLWINHTNKNIQYLRDFFRKVKFLTDKRKVHELYEISFTQDAIRQRLPFSCWVNNKLLADRYQIVQEDPTTATQLLAFYQKVFVYRLFEKGAVPRNCC